MTGILIQKKILRDTETHTEERWPCEDKDGNWIMELMGEIIAEEKFLNFLTSYSLLTSP